VRGEHRGEARWYEVPGVSQILVIVWKYIPFRGEESARLRSLSSAPRFAPRRVRFYFGSHSPCSVFGIFANPTVFRVLFILQVFSWSCSEIDEYTTPSQCPALWENGSDYRSRRAN